MSMPNTINDIPIKQLESMLAKNTLSIDELQGLIAVTTDPERIKLLVMALERARDKEKEKLSQLEVEVEAVRLRVQRVDDYIQRLRETEEERLSSSP